MTAGMPFYVSPEQLMKDKSDYARKGIARGRSVLTLAYADGILFVGENAALEIVVAVGCREGDSRFQCRSEECCERVPYFLPRAVEYGRGGRAIDGLRP